MNQVMEAWRGNSVGAGPCALDLVSSADTSVLDCQVAVVCDVQPNGLVFPLPQLVPFIQQHAKQPLICFDVPSIFARLQSQAEGAGGERLGDWRNAVGNGRLTDIRFLDLQLRRSCTPVAGEELHKWPQIMDRWRKETARPIASADAARSAEAENWTALIHRLTLLLNYYSWLQPRIAKLAAESELIAAPMSAGRLEPDVEDRLNQEHKRQIAAITKRRAVAAVPEPSTPTGRRRRQPSPIDNAVDRNDVVGADEHGGVGATFAEAENTGVAQGIQGERSPEPSCSPEPIAGLSSDAVAAPAEGNHARLGNHVETWADLLFSKDRQPGLEVGPSELARLLLVAEERYRKASEMLAVSGTGVGTEREQAGQPQAAVVASKGFVWDGPARRIKLTKNGYPEIHGSRLSKWLDRKARPLCDVQNEAATIPLQRGGQLSKNPEHWDFWPACDTELWAWREIYRMAEVGRTAGASLPSKPRYETWPRLRSSEPNLAVYRSLGVPVFRARNGHVFMVLRLTELRTRCLASLAIRDECISRHAGRLANYYLVDDDPIGLMAADAQRSIWEGNNLEEAGDGLDGAELSEDAAVWQSLIEVLCEALPLSVAAPLLVRMLRAPNKNRPEC